MATVTAHMRGARGAVKSHGPGDSCGSESERERETFRLSVPTWHRSLVARGPMNASNGSDDVSERITPMPAVRAYPDGGADRLTSFPKILGLTTVTRASENSTMALDGAVIDTRERAESRGRGLDAVNNANAMRAK